MTLQPGTRLGPYEIVSALGAGGMGEVYRARDPRLHRDVAVKVLPRASSADPDRLARFAQEARTIAALSHPNLLAIFDIGTGEIPYLVTELVEGETLRANGLVEVAEITHSTARLIVNRAAMKTEYATISDLIAKLRNRSHATSGTAHPRREPASRTPLP